MECGTSPWLASLAMRGGVLLMGEIEALTLPPARGRAGGCAWHLEKGGPLLSRVHPPRHCSWTLPQPQALGSRAGQ